MYLRLRDKNVTPGTLLINKGEILQSMSDIIGISELKISLKCEIIAHVKTPLKSAIEVT